MSPDSPDAAVNGAGHGQATPPSHAPLIKAVVRGLRHSCGVGDGAAVLVACSGGADSVALLRALHLLAGRRRWGLRLTVGHVQHHLRDDAEGDAVFVAALADTLNLPYLRADLDLSGHVNGPGNVEAAARRARYAALRRLAREADARAVATAHHADDQLETLLMALLRGTTLRGLRGIAWQRPLHAAPPESAPPPEAPPSPEASDHLSAAAHDIRLIRPMLAATHADALAFLHQLGQPWRDDPTNADRSRTRARLRHDVVPVLRDLRPTVARQALRLSDHARAAVKRLDDD